MNLETVRPHKPVHISVSLLLIPDLQSHDDLHKCSYL